MTPRSHLQLLPKAELHLHIEGTLEPELAFMLAERNGIKLPYASMDELRSRYDFVDLQSFLDLYYDCMTVLRTQDDFTALADAYFERAHADGVRHAELFFDPQVHRTNGVPVATVVDGLLSSLEKADRDFGITGGLIMCFLRDEPVESALEVLNEAAPIADKLLGVGLDSAEVGYPPSLFVEVFDAARDLGLRVVAHAGEEGPAEYVIEALDLAKVERVDHGIRALEDPALVRRLREQQVPLTVCPLSNVRLQAVAGISQHPLRHMLEAGLSVSINSDDPAYFGGYIADNYQAAASALGLDAIDLAAIARNSVIGSFATAERKAELVGEIEAWERLSDRVWTLQSAT